MRKLYSTLIIVFLLGCGIGCGMFRKPSPRWKDDLDAWKGKEKANRNESSDRNRDDTSEWNPKQNTKRIQHPSKAGVSHEVPALPTVISDLPQERRPIVAVFDVEAKGIELSSSLLERLSEYLSSRLAETGRFMVIPRDDLKKRLLGQKSKSYKQCYDRSCQIEMGREMAADKTIATQVIKLGSRCMLTSTLYDLKKAATEIAATLQGKCGEDEIVNSLNKVVDELSGKKDGVVQGGVGVFSKPEEKEVEKLSEQAGEVKQPGSNLVWLRCPLGQTWSGSSCQGVPSGMPWAQAMKACPGGYRLPTRQEFVNLLGGCDEKVRGGGYGHCASCGKSARCSSMFGKDTSYYWSSSFAGDSSYAWFVFFDNGYVFYDVKVNISFVRCVRSGP